MINAHAEINAYAQKSCYTTIAADSSQTAYLASDTIKVAPESKDVSLRRCRFICLRFRHFLYKQQEYVKYKQQEYVNALVVWSHAS